MTELTMELFQKAVDETKIFCAEKLGVVPKVKFYLVSEEITPENYLKMKKKLNMTEKEYDTFSAKTNKALISMVNTKKKIAAICIPPLVYKSIMHQKYPEEVFFLEIAHEVAETECTLANEKIERNQYITEIYGDSAVIYFSKKNEKFEKAYEQDFKEMILVEDVEFKRKTMILGLNLKPLYITEKARLDFRKGKEEVNKTFGKRFPIEKIYHGMLKQPHFNS